MKGGPRLQELYIVAVICLLLGYYPKGVIGISSTQDGAIANNLRQLVSAAQQHCIENGVNEVAYDDLVGLGKYLSTVDDVAGESYSEFVYRTTDTEYSVRTETGLLVTYYYDGSGYSLNGSWLLGKNDKKRNLRVSVIIVVAVFVVTFLVRKIRKKRDERSG